MTDPPRSALTESPPAVTDPPVDSQLVWLQAFRHMLHRIEQGEGGLYVNPPTPATASRWPLPPWKT